MEGTGYTTRLPVKTIEIEESAGSRVALYKHGIYIIQKRYYDKQYAVMNANLQYLVMMMVFTVLFVCSVNI